MSAQELRLTGVDVAAPRQSPKRAEGQACVASARFIHHPQFSTRKSVLDARKVERSCIWRSFTWAGRRLFACWGESVVPPQRAAPSPMPRSMPATAGAPRCKLRLRACRSPTRPRKLAQRVRTRNGIDGRGQHLRRSSGSRRGLGHAHSHPVGCGGRVAADPVARAASLSPDAGNDLKVVQAMFGHSGIVLTADTCTSVLPCPAHCASEATAPFVLGAVRDAVASLRGQELGNNADEAKVAAAETRRPSWSVGHSQVEPGGTVSRRGRLAIRPRRGTCHIRGKPAVDRAATC